MPAPYLYYSFAFGEDADDLTAIPVSTAMDGSVSYEQGWTDPYELNLLTNPAALPIPRGQMNQLFYDITNNLQQYQQYGVPLWVTGNTVEYPIYARVYHSGLVYESQEAANTNTPGTDNTWQVISGDSESVRTGTIIEFANYAAPSGYLNCDASEVSRATYAALLGVITFVKSGTLTNGANTITGLANTDGMFIGMPVEGTDVPAGTTITQITPSVTMSANATASDTEDLTFFPFGNGNGTTTFNVPDLRRKVAMGSGGSGTATIGNVVGQLGGAETHTQTIAEMPAHDHPGSTFPVSASPGNLSALEGNTGTGSHDVTVASQGGGAAFNIVQPSVIMNKCIKT